MQARHAYSKLDVLCFSRVSVHYHAVLPRQCGMLYFRAIHLNYYNHGSSICRKTM